MPFDQDESEARVYNLQTHTYTRSGRRAGLPALGGRRPEDLLGGPRAPDNSPLAALMLLAESASQLDTNGLEILGDLASQRPFDSDDGDEDEDADPEGSLPRGASRFRPKLTGGRGRGAAPGHRTHSPRYSKGHARSRAARAAAAALAAREREERLRLELAALEAILPTASGGSIAAPLQGARKRARKTLPEPYTWHQAMPRAAAHHPRLEAVARPLERAQSAAQLPAAEPAPADVDPLRAGEEGLEELPDKSRREGNAANPAAPGPTSNAAFLAALEAGGAGASLDGMYPMERCLRTLLVSSRVRRWCMHEWHYGALDRPWYLQNPLRDFLQHAGLGDVTHLARKEWSVLRAAIRGDRATRRFSRAFIREERIALRDWREDCRSVYQDMGNRPLSDLPPDVPLPLMVGELVTARHPKTRAIYDAKVLTVNRYVPGFVRAEFFFFLSSLFFSVQVECFSSLIIYGFATFPSPSL